MMRSRGRGAATGGGGAMDRDRGRGAGQSAAHLLLQKASTQLRGERVPIKPREEDELASYLNTLAQKTSQQAKSVSYEEYGDISISSGADAMTPRVGRTPSPAIGAGSKFLKKKSQPAADTAESAPPEKKASSGGAYGLKAASVSSSQLADNDDNDDEIAYVGARGTTPASTTQKPGPKFASTSARRGGFQMSSALNKATALANKITQRSSGSNPFQKSRSTLLDSDTDESLALAGRGTNLRGKGSRPGSAASDNSVGHDGNKFMKKRGGESAEVKAEDAVQGKGRQSPARAAAKEKAAAKKTASRGSGQRGGGPFMHGSANVYLTSEEESLAEFIQGLSGSDESRRSPRKAKQIVPKTKWQASKSPSPSPSPNRRSKRSSPSPTPPPQMRGRSGSKHVFHRVSSQDSDTLTSDVAESHDKIVIADSISLDEPLEINLMDANTLGPIVLKTPEPTSFSEHTTRKSSKIRSSPFKKSRSPSPSLKKKSKEKSRKATKKKKEKRDSIFSSFGIQSVEDLLGGVSDKENSEESEITTEPIQTKKRHHDQSTSQIVTELYSRGMPNRQVSYSEDFEASISERIGEEKEKNKGRWARKVSVSSIASQYSDEETGVDYTEDFASETLSMAKYSETDRSSHYRYSDEETEASETISESPRERGGRGEKKVVVETHSVEIQTAAPSGLSYQWMAQTGVSVLGPSLGLDNVDPTPIAATVINPDALEAMTAYSPATLAIHDMLKQQIELIKQFAHAHERLYQALTDSNVPDYKYTTLEGTKAFIRKHRKPRLTMKQALKMVDEEMGR